MSEFLGSTSIAASLVLLLIGSAATLGISVIAIAAGFLVAVPVCAARLSPAAPARFIGGFYVSFFRGVPLLVQLLVIYYALPAVGIELPSFAAAALALALCTAAYQAENLRSGFLIIPHGQVVAARAFGYGRWQTWRHILLPQAARAAIPSVVNEMIGILKASSLVSVVGVADLTRVSENIVARDIRPIQWYGVAAVLYFVISSVIAALGRGTERRLWRGQRVATL